MNRRDAIGLTVLIVAVAAFFPIGVLADDERQSNGDRPLIGFRVPDFRDFPQPPLSYEDRKAMELWGQCALNDLNKDACAPIEDRGQRDQPARPWAK
jgi:hypothetical protein